MKLNRHHHDCVSVTDVDMFTRLCEDHLSVKPSVVRHSCRRLGKPSAEMPRKLLIRLHSESAAQSLLRAARELRHVTMRLLLPTST